MKKIKLFFLMFTLALLGVSNANATKVFATFGTPAGNGSWNAETQTYTWTAGWSNLMPIFTFANGELAEYTGLHLTTSDYVDGPYRVCFMNGGTAVATIAFYSAGEKDLVLSERNETKDLDLSQITSIQFGGASGAGSVKLDPSSVYLVKPLQLQFGDDGKAHIGASDLDVTGNVTIDPATGVITSTGAGTFSVSLPNCDFSAVKRVDVTRSGEEDICNTMSINDAVNGVLNTWYGSKYGCDFTNYQSKAGQVNKITWNVNAAGTMTVEDIVITSDVLTGFVSYVLPEGATDALSFNTAIASWSGTKVSYPTTFAVQGNFWGNNGTSTTNRVDLASADYLSFVVTQGSAQGLALRVWVTDGTTTKTLYAYPAEEAASVANWEESYLIKTPGVYTVKVSGWSLSGVKADNNWGAAPIVVALAYTSKGATPAICDMSNPVLSLSGNGIQTSTAKEVLNDDNATIIDATGITGTGVTLTSANPNCIFLANEGALANTENVCVNGTINKLAITDGKPFALPAEATSATAASYDRVFTAAYSTVCLPFAATFTGKAYEYKAEEANKVTFKEVEGNTLEAGKAYLVEAGFAVTGGSGDLATTPADDAFKGTFEKLTISSDASKSYYGFSNGDFVKVGSNATVNPFRAYLTSTSSAAKLNVAFGEATGISKIDSESKNNAIKAIYGADGAQKSKLTKGINVLKLQNGETVKVNIK